MTVVLERDRRGQSLLTVHCDGCHRSAITDVLAPEAFCALIGWYSSIEKDLCVRCQWRRGMAPSFASRIARAG